MSYILRDEDTAYAAPDRDGIRYVKINIKIRPISPWKEKAQGSGPICLKKYHDAAAGLMLFDFW